MESLPPTRRSFDPEAAGRGLRVIVSVESTVSDRQTVKGFESAVEALPEITEVRRVYGVPDCIVMVDGADGNEYERFQGQKMTKLPEVRHVTSHPMRKLLKGRD